MQVREGEGVHCCHAPVGRGRGRAMGMGRGMRGAQARKGERGAMDGRERGGTGGREGCIVVQEQGRRISCEIFSFSFF